MITVYSVLLNEERAPYLVKERSCMDSNLADSPKKIAEIMNNVFHVQDLPEEKVFVISLDNKCKINGVFELSHGTVNNSFISPREVMLRVLIRALSHTLFRDTISFIGQGKVELHQKLFSAQVLSEVARKLQMWLCMNPTVANRSLVSSILDAVLYTAIQFYKKLNSIVESYSRFKSYGFFR